MSINWMGSLSYFFFLFPIFKDENALLVEYTWKRQISVTTMRYICVKSFQVLLDTHKAARTVVDKACTIDNTYRNFEMDVIAGDADFNATVIEHGRKFEFDFSKVQTFVALYVQYP